MTEPVAEGGPERKILSSPAVKGKLTLLGIVILLGGALLAPPPVKTALSSPQERAAPLIDEQVQVRNAVRPFGGVEETATRVSGYSVAIVGRRLRPVMTLNDFLTGPVPSPVTGFGVRISASNIITHVAALGGGEPVAIALDSGPLDATVAAYDPSTGLVLLRIAPAGMPVAPLAAQPAESGQLVVASARLNGNNLAVPVFVTRYDGLRYSIGAAPSLLPGMPVFNLDGELLALSAGDAGLGVAIAVTDVVERLVGRAESGEGLGSVGLAFQDLDQNLAEVFGATGVVVTEVVMGGPADAAGIAAGDVLVAVGDAACDTPAAALAALSNVRPGTATALSIRRAGRPRVVSAVAGPAHQVAATAFANASAMTGAPQAQSVLPATVREAAGIPASAEVLLLNGRAVTSRELVQRELTRARKPVAVLLRLDDRRFFVTIGAAPR